MGKESTADIAYMVDQSHNLKGKIEAMIQTVCTAQELYAKAALVDHERLQKLQDTCALWMRKRLYAARFWLDTRGLWENGANAKGLPEDPMKAFRESGYLERVTRSGPTEMPRLQRVTRSSGSRQLIRRGRDSCRLVTSANVLCQESPHGCDDLLEMRLEREVSSVEKFDGGARNVAAEGFGSRRDEVRVAFAPDCEQRRL